jgi:hypothetical protein
MQHDRLRRTCNDCRSSDCYGRAALPRGQRVDAEHRVPTVQSRLQFAPTTGETTEIPRTVPQFCGISRRRLSHSVLHFSAVVSIMRGHAITSRNAQPGQTQGTGGNAAGFAAGGDLVGGHAQSARRRRGRRDGPRQRGQEGGADGADGQKLTLADDTGLEVDALKGEPGVRSARFAGDEATYHENNKKLLKLLEGVVYEKRTARFRCVVAIADENGLYECVEGICNGTILEAERGGSGFGYDPLFLADGQTKDICRTFARSEEPHQPSRQSDAKSLGGFVAVPEGGRRKLRAGSGMRFMAHARRFLTALTRAGMKAFILAAGLGTRLRSLGLDAPKVMVPIGGKPLLEHHLELFKRQGIREFIVNLHYLPEKITGYFGDGSKFGVSITLFARAGIAGHSRRGEKDGIRTARRAVHRVLWRQSGAGRASVRCWSSIAPVRPRRRWRCLPRRNHGRAEWWKRIRTAGCCGLSKNPTENRFRQI